MTFLYMLSYKQCHMTPYMYYSRKNMKTNQ